MIVFTSHSRKPSSNLYFFPILIREPFCRLLLEESFVRSETLLPLKTILTPFVPTSCRVSVESDQRARRSRLNVSVRHVLLSDLTDVDFRV